MIDNGLQLKTLCYDNVDYTLNTHNNEAKKAGCGGGMMVVPSSSRLMTDMMFGNFEHFGPACSRILCALVARKQSMIVAKNVVVTTFGEAIQL